MTGARRSSGVLLHPTSLPGASGIGDLGPEAFRFADWLAEAGMRIWQVLPLGPTGYGESPYQLFSAFAGNPLLISLDVLAVRGWLPQCGANPGAPDESVDFERVIPWKTALLRRAFETFRREALAADREEFAGFAGEHAAWLEDYAQFMALKHAHGGVEWTAWGAGARPDPAEIEYQKFLQWEFFREWRALRTYCAARGIRFMGDIPIYVAHDSADVWAHKDLFCLDETGRPVMVAGVPPDYFSATGQLWGNPIYRWDRIAASDYQWWIGRMRAALSLFDTVRMDHFRGFEAYWEVPATEKTAVGGRWVKGPGSELFRALRARLGPLPIVAENLGVITPEVEAIREEFGFPGMAVLQFAFGDDPQAPSFRPHNYTPNLAAYTGTHDNDTAMGWWRSHGGDSTRTTQDVKKEKARARAYLHTGGREMNWTMIRALMASVANTVIFPAQDILGLGSEARMNEAVHPPWPAASGRWRKYTSGKYRRR
ncbi:MAG: 4-alpha-glucanotransferase [Acidobacteriia bacterium]|nr:4-alpha-glucanotransferase [Terriglobia bacterium]